MKKWYQSKTMWISAATIIGGIQANLPALSGVITPAQYGYALIVLGVVNGVVRALTTQSVEK